MSFDNLLRIVSDIKVVNQFSPSEPSEIVAFDSQSSYCNLEESLREDIRGWEQFCNVDKSIICKVEKGFQEIDTYIQKLTSQFDVCFNLHRKTEMKFTEFLKVVHGTTFTKFSRSNSKKTMSRNVYYCSYWDAICWKQASQRFPKQGQMINIGQITQIHTSIVKYQQIKKSFTFPKMGDPECFFAIETKKGINLELLAPNKDVRNLFAKMLGLLVANKGNANCEIDPNFMVTQYESDINLIKKTLESTKQFFSVNIEKLKQSFVQTSQTLLKIERQKKQKIKKKSIMIIQRVIINQKNVFPKNKATFEELLSENKYLIDQKSMLENEVYKLRNQFSYPQQNKTLNYDLARINQLVKNILEINGDVSILNESQGGLAQESQVHQCLQGLEQIKVICDRSGNIEMQLREEIYTLQQNNNLQFSEAQETIDKIQREKEDIMQINEELAMKLESLHQEIERKEANFNDVLIDMKEMQSTVQTLMMSRANDKELEQYKQENAKLKQVIQSKLEKMKQQVIQDERETSALFASLSSILCLLIIPNNLNFSPQTVILKLCKQLPYLTRQGRCELLSPNDSTTIDEDKFLQETANLLERKVLSYENSTDLKDCFIDQLRYGIHQAQYISLRLSYSSQNSTNYYLGSPKQGLKQSGGMQSPQITSWRELKENVNPNSQIGPSRKITRTQI